MSWHTPSGTVTRPRIELRPGVLSVTSHRGSCGDLHWPSQLQTYGEGSECREGLTGGPERAERADRRARQMLHAKATLLGRKRDQEWREAAACVRGKEHVWAHCLWGGSARRGRPSLAWKPCAPHHLPRVSLLRLKGRTWCHCVRAKMSNASNKSKVAALLFDYSFTPNWPHLILWRIRSRYLLQCNYSHIQNIGKCKQYRISTWRQINLVWCFPLRGLKGLQFWKYHAVHIYSTRDGEQREKPFPTEVSFASIH